MKKFISLALLSSLFLSLLSCSPSSVKQTRILLDTVVSVEVSDTPRASDIIAGALDLCAGFELVFDRNNPESEISRINASGGKTVEISGDMQTVLQMALNYCEISDGMFDITVAPLCDLWYFKSEHPAPPSDDQIKNALQFVDYHNVVLNGNTVRLLHGAAIDLGAAAKGYIADQMIDYLSHAGAKNAVVNLGGNVYVLGEPTFVGVQDPNGKTGDTVATLRLTNTSAVTSGIYQRQFNYEGKTYHHLLNPKTGYPYESDLTAVTVLCDRSLLADILSTTVYMLGYEKGSQLIEQFDIDVDAVYCFRSGYTVSSGLTVIAEDMYQ